MSEIDYLYVNLTNLSTAFKEKTNNSYLWLSLVLVGVAISLMTIVGNLMVIFVFIKEKKLQKYSNYFMLNLSVADLIMGFLILPYVLLGLTKNKQFCTIFLVLDYVAGSASVLCIVVISLDRYLLVNMGLDYLSRQKVSHAVMVISTVWVIAFLNYAPAILYHEFTTRPKAIAPTGECQVWFHDNLVYLFVTSCVEFFVPMILITSLNLAVYLNIKRRQRRLFRFRISVLLMKQSKRRRDYALSTSDFRTSILIRQLSDMECENIHRSQAKINLTTFKLNRDKRAATSLFILVLIFFICWAPYTMLTLISSACKSCVNKHLYEISFWLLWLNSTINPFIYPFLHVEFRKSFFKTFRRQRRKPFNL